jgi:tRNA threonylcarbamoyladenosine biosynthesis protein TsaB
VTLTLAIEAATAAGGVALADGERLLSEVLLAEGGRHAEALLPAVGFLLERAGAAPRDIGTVVVGAGPGSFTGVRIAAATARGLVRGLGVPLFAYPSLEVLARSAGRRDRTVCGLFDARRGEVYAGAWRFPENGPPRVVLEPVAATVETVLARLAGTDPLYVGSGALAYAERILASGGVVGPAMLAVPRASALLELLWLDPAAGRVADPAAWEPAYLRPPGAERIAG